MKKLLGNTKLIMVIVPVLMVGLFIAYLVLPTGLPKPIYIEIVDSSSAESPATAEDSTPVHAPHTETKKEPADPRLVDQYAEPGQGIMYDVGSRIVNLLDPIGRRYLKIDVVLEFLPPDHTYFQLEHAAKEAAKEELLKEFEARKPIIDDALTSLLTSKSYEDIYNLEGKNQLRTEIQERLNHELEEPQIVAVYFTEFIIQ